MKRVVYLMVLIAIGVALMPLHAMAAVVVLTKTPVAEFTLPDGSVLKNAYAWKRSSEGIMIIHDDGQYFLNFKTLPDDWRAAYAVADSIEQVASAADARYDQFKIFPIIPRLNGLLNTASTYYQTDRYEQNHDNTLLTACALQSLLDDDAGKAARLIKIIGQLYPKYEQLDLPSMYATCDACAGEGTTTGRCAVCKATGECLVCGGKGEIKSLLENEDADRCTACRGTGKCLKCKGTGKLTLRCSKCSGSGKLLLKAKVNAKLAVQVQRLNQFYTDAVK